MVGIVTNRRVKDMYSLIDVVKKKTIALSSNDEASFLFVSIVNFPQSTSFPDFVHAVAVDDQTTNESVVDFLIQVSVYNLPCATFRRLVCDPTERLE